MRSRCDFQHCLKKAPECGSETRITRRSVKKQLLTKIMMGKRLLWAKKYQNWTKEDLQKVMFSDENNFFVQRHRSQLVRRSPEPKTKKSKKQAEEPAVYVDPPDKVKNAKGKPATLKITSWNVDGLRAWVKKNALEWVTKDSPDILCLQEVKCSAENVPAAVRDLGDFPHQFWSTGVREGLHGVGLLCKEKPLKVTYGINMKEFDEEGRAITAEFDSFILVMAYVPNSGRGLVRLDDRERWDETFCKHLKALQEDKPLVVCGDFNVAYEEIDLKNPKSNKDRTPGFTQRERDGFGRLLDIGLVDSFRKLYPDVQYAYTFWTYMMNARAKNVGWRLDYFLLSNDLMSALCDSKIRSDVRGSDHCPISLRLAM